MCGIVGYAGRREATDILLESLRRLEYRGYDSAGIVVLDGHGLEWEKRTGRISALEESLQARPLHGHSGLGHTRWATHGGVTTANAHPHFSCDGLIAVVHNGIIENYAELRRRLEPRHRFASGTDTEVIPHLIEDALRNGAASLLAAVNEAISALQGSLAIGVLHGNHSDDLIVARINSPLVLGVGQDENFVASDIPALLPFTRQIIPLEENELARVRPEGIRIYDRQLRRKLRRPLRVTWNAETAVKNGHPHYMLQEIHAQPGTLAAEVTAWERGVRLQVPRDLQRAIVVGCGSAWHAGGVTKCAIEELARIPVELAYASELRYGDPIFGRKVLAVAISQSGETADTLAAARAAREGGSTVLAITNVAGSTLAREADEVLLMSAGPEVGVAATKTYTSQVMNGLLLAMHLGRIRGTLRRERRDALLEEARRLPEHVARILESEADIRGLAAQYREGFGFMFLGRRYNLATALEGALKMKEITYFPAEGHGAGEMKHGPLSLVDERTVCVAIAPACRTTGKMISNIEEVRARGGIVLSVSTEGEETVTGVSAATVRIPPCDEMFSPILAVVPLQLLAYHRAVALGRDVDRPRNLAKSVTVE